VWAAVLVATILYSLMPIAAVMPRGKSLNAGSDALAMTAWSVELIHCL